MYNSDNQVTERSPGNVSFLLTHYEELAGRIGSPELIYAAQWDAYIRKGDADPTQFDSLEAYRRAFPVRVQGSEAPLQLAISLPGSGMGATHWVMRYFPREGEPGTLVVIYHQEDAMSPESWVRAFSTEDGLPEITQGFVPEISLSHFFGDAAHSLTAIRFGLVQTIAKFNEDGQIEIQTVKNHSLECVGGKPRQSGIPAENATEICAAWEGYQPKTLTLGITESGNKLTIL